MGASPTLSKAVQYLREEYDTIVNGSYSDDEVYQEAFDRVMEITKQDHETSLLALELTGFDAYLK